MQETSSGTSRAGARQGRVLRLMLEVCGTQGYHRAACGWDCGDPVPGGAEFFRDPEGCFAAAYRERASALCDDLLARSRQSTGPRRGVEAAVRRLASFLGEEPAVARSLLVEVRAAGPRSAAERARLLDRLSEALDRAHRDLTGAAPSPSRTAFFMVTAIEEIARRASLDRDPGRLAEMATELASMVGDAYRPGGFV